MPSLEEIRAGIAANLDAIEGLQANAYELTNATPPTAFVVPVEVAYDRAMQRGFDLWKLRVTVLVGATTDIGSQKRLDRMLDPSGSESVKAAIESDDTLGGVVDDLHVTRASGYRQYPREGGVTALGAEWDVEVWADGS